MQMVEMRVRHYDEIDSWQVTKLNPGFPQALQHEQPAREIRIKNYVLPPYLDKKTGVPNKGHAHVSIADQLWLMSLSAARGHSRMTHQTAESASALAKHRILKACI